MMEREAFFSGYCRQADDSRMVCVVAEGKQLLESDCCYPDCPFAANCVLAQNIEAFLMKE